MSGRQSAPLLTFFHIIRRRDKRLEFPGIQSDARQNQMKKISDLFTDEEKAQLSYLGSILHQEPTEEEEEQQKDLGRDGQPRVGKTNRVEECQTATGQPMTREMIPAAQAASKTLATIRVYPSISFSTKW